MLCTDLIVPALSHSSSNFTNTHIFQKYNLAIFHDTTPFYSVILSNIEFLNPSILVVITVTLINPSRNKNCFIFLSKYTTAYLSPPLKSKQSIRIPLCNLSKLIVPHKLSHIRCFRLTCPMLS